MPAIGDTRCLRVLGVRRGRMDELSGRLFAAGAVGLSEDWLPGQAPPPRQPWDPPGEAADPDPVLVQAFFDQADEPMITAWASGFGGVEWVTVEARDWEAESRASFPPVEVVPGWWLAPPWDAPPGALLIDPGSGFGTGHHASTRTALRLLLRAPARGGSALDVGCGSGVLALAAARLGFAAWGIDVEPAAVRDAERNAALNGLSARFSTTPLDDIPAGGFELVLANLHAELLAALGPPLIARTGGRLIVAGVLADREPAVHATFERHLRCVDREVEGEWVALTWQRSG
jgi:ribosomal protein L11 methyltransferase